MKPNPTIGRIVLYVLNDGISGGQVRPAIITRVWTDLDHASNPGMVNLHVFTDGNNDAGQANFAGSVCYSADGSRNTWSYPEIKASRQELNITMDSKAISAALDEAARKFEAVQAAEKEVMRERKARKDDDAAQVEEIRSKLKEVDLATAKEIEEFGATFNTR